MIQKPLRQLAAASAWSNQLYRQPRIEGHLKPADCSNCGKHREPQRALREALLPVRQLVQLPPVPQNFTLLANKVVLDAV